MDSFGLNFSDNIAIVWLLSLIFVALFIFVRTIRRIKLRSALIAYCAEIENDASIKPVAEDNT